MNKKYILAIVAVVVIIFIIIIYKTINKNNNSTNAKGSGSGCIQVEGSDPVKFKCKDGTFIDGKGNSVN